MKPINTKRLFASAMIFLFTNFTVPVASVAGQGYTPPIVSQELSVSSSSTPLVTINATQVIDVAHDTIFGNGHKISIQSLECFPTLLSPLQKSTLTYDQGATSVVRSCYGNDPTAYVSLSRTDVKTGLIYIENAQNDLEKGLQLLLSHPEKYNVRPNVVSPQLMPKIVSDSGSKAKLLLMDPTDFRLVSDPHYNQATINQLLLNSYVTFKGYVQMMHKMHPGQPVVIHTGYWGMDYNNNPRVTSAIQLIAASLAGVDKLVFHIEQNNELGVQPLFDAQLFIQSQQGHTIANITKTLLKQTAQADWAINQPMPFSPDHDAITAI